MTRIAKKSVALFLTVAVIVLPFLHAAGAAYAAPHGAPGQPTAEHAAAHQHIEPDNMPNAVHPGHGCAQGHDTAGGDGSSPDPGLSPDCGAYPVCHIVILPSTVDASTARARHVFETISARALLARDAQPPLTPPRA